jgi:hypothetical protein
MTSKTIRIYIKKSGKTWYVGNLVGATPDEAEAKFRNEGMTFRRSDADLGTEFTITGVGKRVSGEK